MIAQETNTLAGEVVETVEETKSKKTEGGRASRWLRVMGRKVAQKAAVPVTYSISRYCVYVFPTRPLWARFDGCY